MKWTLLAASTVVSLSAADSSSENLLNLLQKKGILTQAEAETIRQEQNQAASAAKPKPETSSWASNTKISGDFRARFEGLYGSDPAFQDRNRFRYRMRAGLVSSLTDNFEIGLRLASGEGANGVAGGDPISGNATFQDNASKKLLFVDLAYAKWRFLQHEDWTGAFIVGKMENPFVFSDIVFDHDYTPEGIAQQFTYKLNDRHRAGLTLARFAVDGIGVIERDAFIAGAQFRLDSKLDKSWQTSAGVAALVLTGENELVNGAVANQNRGNSRPGPNEFGVGALGENFAPIVADASVTYTFESAPLYPGRFPVKLAGDYMYNAAGSIRNQATSIGVTFGKSGKRGQWDVAYRWKYLESDVWYEELVDSDFGGFYRVAPDAGGSAGYGAGTNVRGHVVKASYSLTDALTLGATAAFSELIQTSPTGSDSAFSRVQLDASWKF